jgi:hypothetical protein
LARARKISGEAITGRGGTEQADASAGQQIRKVVLEKSVIVPVQAVAQTHSLSLSQRFRLAGALGHIARAQALLAEELFGLPDESKQEKAAGESAEAGEDDTPVDGLRPR